MVTQKFLDEKFKSGSDDYQPLREKVVCADGFSMSVQASEYHYCFSRSNGKIDYLNVEVGFPSMRVDEFMPFIDGGEDTDPTQTVYGYVPIGIVDAVIEKHGGINAV